MFWLVTAKRLSAVSISVRIELYQQSSLSLIGIFIYLFLIISLVRDQRQHLSLTYLPGIYPCNFVCDGTNV